MDALIGKWTVIASENLDELLKKLGMNFLFRKLAKTMKPNIKIEKNENEWTITLITPIKNMITKFEIDKPFDDTCLNGKSVTSSIRLENNKMIQEQKDSDGNLVLLITREINENDELLLKFQADDVICLRTLARVTDS